MQVTKRKKERKKVEMKIKLTLQNRTRRGVEKKRNN